MKRPVPVLGLCFALVLGACSKSENKSESMPLVDKLKAAVKTETGPTASDQPNNEADRQIVKEIRQAVTKDDALSTSAQNVTIVSQEGNVTLRGTVKDQNEKDKIAAKAQQVAGVTKVDNQLVVTQ